MNVVLGVAVVFLCTIVQCAFTAGIKILLPREIGLSWVGGRFWRMTVVLSCVTSILFVGMMVQVYIWALILFATGEIETFRTAAYFSMVNFTSLGYGDITLSEERAILGPMEAANGILMLGLSTSALFTVLREPRVSSQGDRE